MKKTILCAALVLSVSACFSTGATFQRWVGTYEYDGVTCRVALVQNELFTGESQLQYELVPETTTTYMNVGSIASCRATEEIWETRLIDISRCEQSFARQIDTVAGPPAMEGGDYG